MKAALYKDKFVVLYSDELVISQYFFPICTEKRIALKSVQRVYYKQQAFLEDLFVSKDWGMSLTPVWWACDLHRHIQHKHFNVVIDTGTAIKKGFSVEDVAAFLNALATVSPASVENGFPKSYSQNIAIPAAFPPKPHVMPIIKPEKELNSEEKHPFVSSPVTNESIPSPPPYNEAVDYPKIKY